MIPSATAMASSTAVTLLLLTAGIALFNPSEPPVAALTTEGPSGQVLRRLLPATLLVPFAVGVLRVIAERKGLVGPGAGVLIMVGATFLVGALVVWIVAERIGRLDAERLAATDGLARGEARLGAHRPGAGRDLRGRRAGSLRARERALGGDRGHARAPCARHGVDRDAASGGSGARARALGGRDARGHGVPRPVPLPGARRPEHVGRQQRGAGARRGRRHPGVGRHQRRHHRPGARAARAGGARAHRPRGRRRPRAAGGLRPGRRRGGAPAGRAGGRGGPPRGAPTSSRSPWRAPTRAPASAPWPPRTT